MDWLKCDIVPTMRYEHPKIEQAAAHIVRSRGKGGSK
jgi:hypothetical protein